MKILTLLFIEIKDGLEYLSISDQFPQEVIERMRKRKCFADKELEEILPAASAIPSQNTVEIRQDSALNIRSRLYSSPISNLAFSNPTTSSFDPFPNIVSQANSFLHETLSNQLSLRENLNFSKTDSVLHPEISALAKYTQLMMRNSVILSQSGETNKDSNSDIGFSINSSLFDRYKDLMPEYYSSILALLLNGRSELPNSHNNDLVEGDEKEAHEKCQDNEPNESDNKIFEIRQKSISNSTNLKTVNQNPSNSSNNPNILLKKTNFSVDALLGVVK